MQREQPQPADGPQRDAILRMRDNLVVLLGALNGVDPGDLDIDDIDGFEDIDFDRITREFEEDAQTMEDFTDFACFGEGTFDPPTPEDPDLAAYCDSFEEFTDLVFFIEDPAELAELTAQWFDDTEAIVPAEIAADFGVLHRWFDDMMLEVEPAELDALFDTAPQSVQDAGNRFGEWSDDRCDV